MREITIVNTNKRAIVDDEDYDTLSKFKWYLHSAGYALTSIKRVNKYMHKYLVETNLYVDHINRNRLDNRKSNLRIVNASFNGINSVKRNFFNATSSYKGVAWFPLRNKWRARIKKDYKSIHIGLFESEIEAALAYNAKAFELFGTNANLNKI